MKPEEMMDTIGKIDDEHIEEFAQVRPSRFLIPWGMVATVAAFCLVIGTAVFLRGAGIFPGETTPPDTTTPPSTGETTAPPTTTAPPETTNPPFQPFRPSGTRLQGYAYSQLASLLESDGSWLNNTAESGRFLTPQSMNLANLIRYTYRHAEDLTAEETAFLQNAGFGIYLDGGIRRAPGAEVRQLLAEHFGITPEQLSISPYELLVYWEETDCYYVCEHGMHADFAAHSAYMQENGLIHLYYNTAEKATQLPEYVMILQPTDTGYRLLSNWLRAEEDLAAESALQTLIPDIGADLPEGDGPVFDRYSFAISWYNSRGDLQEVTLRVPALRPDSEGAKAINDQIRSRMESELRSLRSAYQQGGYTSMRSIDYEYWYHGDILAVILRETDTSAVYEYEYYLNTATGQQLDDNDLVGMSHLERLYRSCSILKAHIGEDHRDGCGMFVGIRMDKMGQLWVSHKCLSPDAQQQEFLFDPGSGGAADEGEMYHWIFNIIADAAFSQQQSHHLQAVFAEEPELFLHYLSSEVKECGQVIGSQLLYERTQEEKDAHLALCTSLRDNATDPAISETAQLLIDAFNDPGAGSIWATCRACFQSITDLDSAMKLSKPLHYCCFEDIRSFIRYMYMLDEAYYDYCWQAVIAEATQEQIALLEEAAAAVLDESDTTDSEQAAAASALRIIGS